MYDSPLGKLSFPDQANTNRLQFFASLFDANEVVYLDPNRHYCIIKTHLYTNIKDELTASLANQQKLQKQLLQAQLATTSAAREAKVYREQLQNISNNAQTLAKEYQKVCERNKEYQRNEAQLRQMIKQSRGGSAKEVRQQQKIPKIYVSECCQTEWQVQPQEEPIHPEALEQPVPPAQIEAVEQRLYQLLQSEMEKFQQQFERKVGELEQQRLSIDRWEEENRQLREENAKLQQQMVERNIEEEKLQAWRHSVAGFIDRIESSIVHPQPQPVVEEGGSGEASLLKAEVVELRGRLVEMRSRMRRIDELMECEGEVSDEGAIGVLVRLSQKVKAVVKNMVMEIEEL